MHRFAVVVALLGLSACGGTDAVVQRDAPLNEVEQESLCSGHAWECFCAKQKTEATCNQATTGNWHCVWTTNRCLPTYE
ncbi:hypothetical protein A176_004867 [Myxococcus hansupus]|uniref:Lipoprotein n=1 Tax=Pseudomyxococcus hansupus TaxID=1297742 RepID=A0A0H4X2T1_9BACT|nr:hypothetical protein [Myxococcus hansupus]AKQ67955.1 hypothetical protein A176_004867 [Myxococcus hansupus]